MKGFIFALCILIGSTGLCGAVEKAAPDSLGKDQVDIDLSFGFSHARDCETGEAWKVGPGLGIGINYVHPIRKNINLRAGISEQSYSNRRLVEHPYPYVMDLRTEIITASTRITMLMERTFPKNAVRPKKFIGAGIYGDWVFTAEAKNTLYYVSDTQSYKQNALSSFRGITPGLVVNIGACGKRNRIEIRYATDLGTFQIKGIPIGRQRRSFIGMNYAFGFALD